MEFKNFTNDYYSAVCNFLIELNKYDKDHINWNWARFEWMFEHPEFDKNSFNSIGLWLDNDKVVGAAIYDMYFGEAFCAVLPEYKALYPEVLNYSYKELKDNSGLGISICDDNSYEIEAAEKLGFTINEQTETVMSLKLDKTFSSKLPDRLSIEGLDQKENAYELQWLFWQGFDHGTDKAEFEKKEKIIPRIRPHFNRSLSLSAVNESGEKVAYCCLWYSEKTDYAYVEPVCTIPSYRGRGIAKALIYEALNRVRKLGAKKAYVISDTDFYKKLGFKIDKHFTFYWKS